ncbi:MAG: hypothetical protein COX02_00445 [Candidatus Vogelbacteria bacterium CG22_combo_CG10-13_8_21_14_all_37_9]|uniref:Ribosome-binding factor A n=1 Tax=Candidatus Vogelbacteria bacterium CG22_combo_CG10-13_8_21_14_all_37_9 TaxID=1975046 RepID=A0A2H0BN18_9BACT|nr:MAG: hypothetical protein BK005_01395 [bacterium CG10_37_50]PIP58430.1 MAG: hypothetical protein COX02_00445 [Candidatus Vogelbacteria bacterium CG22_combo_CG10-13_8_21_14_all_37_9]
MNLHQQKTLALIRDLSARFFQQNSNGKSLLTVTNCLPSHDGKKVTVLLSVLPEKYEAEALRFARFHRGDLRTFIRDNSRIYNLPLLDVELDLIEKGRRLVDEVKRVDDLKLAQKNTSTKLEHKKLNSKAR